MSYNHWSPADIRIIRRNAKTTPAGRIGRMLKPKRTESAVRQKARVEGISLTGGLKNRRSAA